MINIKEAREAYNYDILDDIIWMRCKFNLADAITKQV